MSPFMRSVLDTLREYFSLTVSGPCSTIREQRRRPKGGAPEPVQKRFSIFETIRKQRLMVSPGRESGVTGEGSGNIVHVESVTAHYLNGGLDSAHGHEQGKKRLASGAEPPRPVDGERGNTQPRPGDRNNAS